MVNFSGFKNNDRYIKVRMDARKLESVTPGLAVHEADSGCRVPGLSGFSDRFWRGNKSILHWGHMTKMDSMPHSSFFRNFEVLWWIPSWMQHMQLFWSPLFLLNKPSCPGVGGVSLQELHHLHGNALGLGVGDPLLGSLDPGCGGAEIKKNDWLAYSWSFDCWMLVISVKFFFFSEKWLFGHQLLGCFRPKHAPMD